jgi:hypothetical protein
MQVPGEPKFQNDQGIPEIRYIRCMESRRRVLTQKDWFRQGKRRSVAAENPTLHNICTSPSSTCAIHHSVVMGPHPLPLHIRLPFKDAQPALHIPGTAAMLSNQSRCGARPPSLPAVWSHHWSNSDEWASGSNHQRARPSHPIFTINFAVSSTQLLT